METGHTTSSAHQTLGLLIIIIPAPGATSRDLVFSFCLLFFWPIFF